MEKISQLYKFSGPRLERRNAKKSISYDSSGSNRRRKPRQVDRDGDESEGSTHSQNDWSVDEFSVHGRESVEEMNNLLRHLGLPGPANLGIERDLWEGVKLSPSPSGIGDGRRRSIAGGEESFGSTFSFDTNRYAVPATPSQLSPGLISPQDPAQESVFRAVFGLGPSPHSSRQSAGGVEVRPTSASSAMLEASLEPARDNNGRVRRKTRDFSNVVKDAVAEAHKNEAEAAEVSSFIETHRVSRTDSWPNYGSSSQDSRVPSNGDRIERALSEPVDTSGLTLGETSILLEKHVASRDVNGQSSLSKVHLENFSRGQNSVNRDSQALNLLRTEESSKRDRDLSTRLNVLQSDQLHSAVGGMTEASDRTRPGTTPAANSRQSVSIGPLKLPPPLTVLRMPENSSTQDIFNSLGPDDFEPTAKLSSDDDERLSEEDDNSERDNPDVEERNFTGDSTLEGGQVPSGTIEADSRVPGQSSVPALVLQEAEKVVTVQVPDQEPQIMNLSTIGQNPDPDSELRDIARPSDHHVGPRFPWEKGDLLGAGSFGTVYEAVDSDGMFFAVKEVSLLEQDKQAQQAISQLMQEIELLSQFKHDNIVQYLGTEKADGKLYIFLELVSKGSLASICKKFKLSHSHISVYTKQILRGLKFLHDQCIVHRDIKCANILVDVSGTCKLADFGMAKRISSLDQTKSCKGSAYWMAPEVIDPKKTYGNPADIWSLGCSILEMATGSPPFGDMEWYRVLWTVGHGNAPPIPDFLSDSLKDFVKQCLEINPMKRPTATELLDHPFIRQAGTPRTNSGQLNTPSAVNNLDTIAEERSADLATESMNSLQEGGTLSTRDSNAEGS